MSAGRATGQRLTPGGVAATLVPTELDPVLVGPATGAEFNAIIAGIIPVACWRVEDIRFEFDSSFPLPGIKVELEELKTLIKKHPDSPLSVFGHADPVGNDDYNKALSGRRSTAIYGLLVRDTGLWEALFSQPLGNDRWGAKALEVMQAEVNAPPAGGGTPPAAGPSTAELQASAGKRKALYAAYMDKLAGPELSLKKQDFLARGADARGKGDFQGCSEFNPILIFSQQDQQRFEAAADKGERNAANTPNRRVMVLLFRKGSRVEPARWPCPRAAEGVAGCRKRFWSDGEARRSRRLPAEPRRFEDTQDTFACRFYHRLTTGSPCEKEPVVPKVTLEFVFDTNGDHKADASDAVTTFTRMGLWDNAFDATKPVTVAGALLNAEAEANNFVGADSRRFYLRVTDPSTSTSLKVKWRTLKEDGTDLDRPADETVTLLETAANSGVFTSRALMLVCDKDDHDQDTDSGLPAGNPDAGKRKKGQSNHRLRRASMLGFVEAEYAPGRGAPVTMKLPVFDRSPDERRRLPVQVFVLRVAAGGAGNIPTAPGSGIFGVDLRVMKESYERIGVKVETVVRAGTPAGDIARDGPDSVVLIDPPAAVTNPNNVSFADEEALATANPALPDTIRVFFVRRLASVNGGEAWPEVDFAALARRGCAFTIQATGPYAAGHEAGHLLTNKSNAAGAAVPGHFAAPAAPAGNRFRNFQNLMKAQFLGPETALGPKRLWDVTDTDANNQFTAIRGSHFTRTF